MKYVKKLLSEKFKEQYKIYSSLHKEEWMPDEYLRTQREVYDKLRQLIYVSRLIMNMQEFDLYLMPYIQIVRLEQELCKPLNTEQC